MPCQKPDDSGQPLVDRVSDIDLFGFRRKWISDVQDVAARIVEPFEFVPGERVGLIIMVARR